MDKSVIHKDDDTHFVWVQNLPSDEQDGVPDCEGLYESLDEIDVLLSVMLRGAKLNLDPTLVIKDDKLFVQRMGIKKGSENAIVVDKEGGDAKYLELTGSSIEAGIKLFNEHRRTILEVAECVIPDPDTIAAQGQSAAAQKMVFSRMLSKGGILQEQYGTSSACRCRCRWWTRTASSRTWTRASISPSASRIRTSWVTTGSRRVSRRRR